LGVNLLSATILLSQISTPASASQTYSQTEPPPFLVNEEKETKTKDSLQAPLESFQISQGFHLFHPAIDLAAPLGTPIKPIAPGIVEKVEYGSSGFGNNILLDHGTNLKSFYAHLGKIKVKKGEEVFLETTIGTVGLSGRTTGPHLHLEILKNNQPLNPKTILFSPPIK